MHLQLATSHGELLSICKTIGHPSNLDQSDAELAGNVFSLKRLIMFTSRWASRGVHSIPVTSCLPQVPRRSFTPSALRHPRARTSNRSRPSTRAFDDARCDGVDSLSKGDNRDVRGGNELSQLASTQARKLSGLDQKPAVSSSIRLYTQPSITDKPDAARNSNSAATKVETHTQIDPRHIRRSVTLPRLVILKVSLSPTCRTLRFGLYNVGDGVLCRLPPNLPVLICAAAHHAYKLGRTRDRHYRRLQRRQVNFPQRPRCRSHPGTRVPGRAGPHFCTRRSHAHHERVRHRAVGGRRPRSRRQAEEAAPSRRDGGDAAPQPRTRRYAWVRFPKPEGVG